MYLHVTNMVIQFHEIDLTKKIRCKTVSFLAIGTSLMKLLQWLLERRLMLRKQWQIGSKTFGVAFTLPSDIGLVALDLFV